MTTNVQDQVREHYAKAATTASPCCGSAASECCAPALYSIEEQGEVPAEALQASLGGSARPGTPTGST